MPSETKRVELCERDLEPGQLLVRYTSQTATEDPYLTTRMQPASSIYLQKDMYSSL